MVRETEDDMHRILRCLYLDENGTTIFALLASRSLVRLGDIVIVKVHNMKVVHIL